MAHQRDNYQQLVEQAQAWLRENVSLQSLSPDLRREIEGEVLETLFFRKIVKNKRFNAGYIAKLVKYEQKIKRRDDPYVEKARRRFKERRERGFESDLSSLRMIPATGTRSLQKEPIEELIAREESQLERSQISQIRLGVEKLSARAQAVMKKFLRGEKLHGAERSVRHRAVTTLSRLLHHP